MIFMWAFLLLCVFTVRNTLKVRKLRRRLDSFEVTLKLRDDDTKQTVPGVPLGVPEPEEDRCFICADNMDCPAAFCGVMKPCPHFKYLPLCSTCFKQSDCPGSKGGVLACSEYNPVVTQAAPAASLDLQQ